MTARTRRRLLVGSYAFNFNSSRGRLLERSERNLLVFLAHAKLDASHQVRNEPVHANHVVVDEERFNPSRLEGTLGQ